MTDEIKQTLEWIGVTDSTNIANIRDNFTTFDELSQLTASNISDLVDDFRRRTITAGKYDMPLTIQKRLKFTINWLLDLNKSTELRHWSDLIRIAFFLHSKRQANVPLSSSNIRTRVIP